MATTKKELYRIRCEKLVNESWGEARKHLDKLHEIFQSGAKNTEEVKIIIKAAFAFLQRATLEETEDQEILECETCE